MQRYLARPESRRHAANFSRDPVYGDPQAALDPWSKFMCGLAAGSTAKAICHPLDVVKKRFQVRAAAAVEVHMDSSLHGTMVMPCISMPLLTSVCERLVSKKLLPRQVQVHMQLRLQVPC